MSNVTKGGGGGSTRTRATTRTRSDRPDGSSRSAGRILSKKMQQDQQAADYNAALQLYAQSQGGSGSGGGGGGGGGGFGGGFGGFGGGGRQGPDVNALIGKLNSQRDAARGALPGYLKQYESGIAKVGKENAGLTKGYSAQIKAIMNELIGRATQEQSMLTRDVGAQGGGLEPIRAEAAQNVLGLRSMGGAQDAYNLRLAQIMGAATADRRGMGKAINLSAQSQLDDSYMRALMALEGMR
jgi:hypothetical protein